MNKVKKIACQGKRNQAQIAMNLVLWKKYTYRVIAATNAKMTLSKRNGTAIKNIGQKLKINKQTNDKTINITAIYCKIS